MEAKLASQVTIECKQIRQARNQLLHSMAPHLKPGTSRKTRHIQLRFLYMQDLVHMGILRLKKIAGDRNPSDVLTLLVKLGVLRKHLQDLGLFSSMGQFQVQASVAQIC